MSEELTHFNDEFNQKETLKKTNVLFTEIMKNIQRKLNGFFPNNRPLKLVFLKDLEDPYYNQVLYTPVLGFNVYDGFSPGIRFHNKTILNKPFTFDMSPMYSSLSY